MRGLRDRVRVLEREKMEREFQLKTMHRKIFQIMRETEGSQLNLRSQDALSPSEASVYQVDTL